jgi:hypothetical protein
MRSDAAMINPIMCFYLLIDFLGFRATAMPKSEFELNGNGHKYTVINFRVAMYWTVLQACCYCAMIEYFCTIC